MKTSQVCFNVIDKVKVNIEITENKFGFNLNDLFEMGVRVNPKRTFLFVSKLLGKHLDVNPQVPKVAGHLLAGLIAQKQTGKDIDEIYTIVNGLKQNDYSKECLLAIEKQLSLPKKTLIIGFAETATGLGCAVASALTNAYYVQTTREEFINHRSLFDFEEEHSHATGHMCYLSDMSIIEECEQIVLVDDEITTGKTALNLIRSINTKYPNKEYVIASLLDWRNKQHEERYLECQNEIEVTISSVALLRGEIDVLEENPIEEETTFILNKSDEYKEVFIPLPKRMNTLDKSRVSAMRTRLTGMFGMSAMDMQNLEESCKAYGEYFSICRQGSRTLCLGTEEFIYIPSRIASYLGEGVSFKSTTRSPIYVKKDKAYVIKDKLAYSSEDGSYRYLYNIEPGAYDEAIIFTENNMTKIQKQEISYALKERGIEHILFANL